MGQGGPIMLPFGRRDTLRLGLGALAGTALSGSGLLVPRARAATAPAIEVEKGATLRVMRPAKFVAGDEIVFMKNTQLFTEKTGCEVKVEMQSWEDLRPKTAVAANVGAGPDIVLAWLDDPHLYPDKLLDLTDIATY